MTLEQAMTWLERMPPGAHVLTYTRPLDSGLKGITVRHVIQWRTRLAAADAATMVLCMRTYSNGEPSEFVSASVVDDMKDVPHVSDVEDLLLDLENTSRQAELAGT